MAKGIKISKQRRNVKQASESELVLDSTRPGSLKIHDDVKLQIITTWVVGPQQDYTVSAPHNLGYVPAYSAVVNVQSIGYSFQVPLDLNGTVVLNVYVDNKNVYAHCQATTRDTYTFHIVIFEERLDV